MASLHRLLLDPACAENSLRDGSVGPREEGVLTCASALIPCLIGAQSLPIALEQRWLIGWGVQTSIVLIGMVLAFRANALGDGREFGRRCICVAPGHFIRAFVLLSLAYWASLYLLGLAGAHRASAELVLLYPWLARLVLVVSFAGLISSLRRLSSSSRAGVS